MDAQSDLSQGPERYVPRDGWARVLFDSPHSEGMPVYEAAAEFLSEIAARGISLRCWSVYGAGYIASQILAPTAEAAKHAAVRRHLDDAWCCEDIVASDEGAVDADWFITVCGSAESVCQLASETRADLDAFVRSVPAKKTTLAKLCAGAGVPFGGADIPVRMHKGGGHSPNPWSLDITLITGSGTEEKARGSLEALAAIGMTAASHALDFPSKISWSRR